MVDLICVTGSCNVCSCIPISAAGKICMLTIYLSHVTLPTTVKNVIVSVGVKLCCLLEWEF